ncbi:hypothetical protein ACOSQ2_021369 [Xanthoceras sorbifolium]
MPIGEVFLSASLQVLFDRLAPQNLSFLSRPDLVPVESTRFKNEKNGQIP